MSNFSDNMDYLAECNVPIHDIISSKLALYDKSLVDIFESKINGAHIKIKKPNGDYIIHSSYDPYKEAERWTEGIDFSANVIVVFGLGLGYHIDILKDKIKKGTSLIIIEPDIGIFKEFLKYRKFLDIFSGDIKLLLSDDPNSISSEIFNTFKSNLLGKVTFHIFSGYRPIYGQLFDEIKERFSDIIKTLHTNVSTTEYFKNLWLVNFLMNSLQMNGCINGQSLKNRFKGLPAIIVSAGPSLDKNIEQLRGLTDKAIIFSAGSSIRSLLKRDIKPHFTIAIDGAPMVSEIYDGLDIKDICLIYINRLFYQVVEKYSQKKVLFIDDRDKLSRIISQKLGIELEELPPDQTVAGFAVSIAAYVGCDPIIFVGQDLALTNFEFHSSGAAHMFNLKNEIENNKGDYIAVKDIYGNDTYTMKSLLSAKISLEYKVLLAKENGHYFINATEGGIGLKDTKNMSLNDVCEKYLVLSKDITRKVIDEFNNTTDVIKFDENLLKEFYDDLDKKAKKLGVVLDSIFETGNRLKTILQTNNLTGTNYSKLAIQMNSLQNEVENDVL
jgi:hypothetical protein